MVHRQKGTTAQLTAQLRFNCLNIDLLTGDAHGYLGHLNGIGRHITGPMGNLCLSGAVKRDTLCQLLSN